jgi:fructan beta-fructosidase
VIWLDYGPDSYAGVTWSNTGNRKIFLGWMSNWNYANVVPTEVWRNAMTFPRELKLKRIANRMLIASQPVKELTNIKSNSRAINSIVLKKPFELSKRIDIVGFPCWMKLDINKGNDFEIVLSNEAGDELLIGFNKGKNEYYIDRSKSGMTGFHKDFPGKYTAPRISKGQAMDLQLVFDVSSVELFADGGLTVMTSIFFPRSLYNKIIIQSSSGTFIDKLEYSRLKPSF